MHIKEMLKAWKKIYSNWKYSLAVVLIALGFFLLNIIIRNFSSIKSNAPDLGFLGTLKFLINLTLGFYNTIYLEVYLSVIIIGILAGFLFTLIAFKTSHKSEKKIGFLGTIGIFLGVAAPNCAVCGIGLLSFFGISAIVLASLPFRGFELSLIAIAILLYSNWRLTKGLLECKTCKVKFKYSKK